MNYDDINKAFDILLMLLSGLAAGGLIFILIWGLLPILGGMLAPFIMVGRLLFSAHPYIYAILFQTILTFSFYSNGKNGFSLKPVPVMILLSFMLLALITMPEASASFMVLFLGYIITSLVFGLYSRKVHLFNLAAFGLLSFGSMLVSLGISLPFALLAVTPVCQALLLVTTLAILFRVDEPAPLAPNATEEEQVEFNNQEDQYERNYHIRMLIAIIETCAAIMSIFLGPLAALLTHTVTMSLLQLIKTNDPNQDRYLKLTITTFVFDYLLVLTPLGKFTIVKTLATQVAPKLRTLIDFIFIYRLRNDDPASDNIIIQIASDTDNNGPVMLPGLTPEQRRRWGYDNDKDLDGDVATASAELLPDAAAPLGPEDLESGLLTEDDRAALDAINGL